MLRTLPLRRVARPLVAACLALQPIGNVISAEGEGGADRTLVAPGTLTLAPGLPSDWSATWTQVGGRSAGLVPIGTQDALVHATTPGRRRFRLTANGPLGATIVDEVEVFAFGDGGGATVSGGEHLWHAVTLDVEHGTSLDEQGTPNPFTDRRLDVTLWHPASGEVLTVPGFFAADGQAADTHATSGSTFRARFTPSRSGAWRYLVSARAGVDVAYHDDALVGAPSTMDAVTGTFEVGPLDPDAPGNLARGVLRYVDEHHLSFEGTGERFLKAGADSPENWLGYHEFDQTVNLGGLWEGALPNGLHTFSAHVQHFQATTPEAQAATWDGGKGAGILGALDYLASRGVNSFYFLTYNVDGGDGRDTWPWTAPGERFRFDVSKLAQWERVFSYADARGLQLHVVLQELENEFAMGGDLSPIRRLYYRETIARFAHHLAVQWNLGEENTNSVQARCDFADYFQRHDAYHHPCTFHTNYGAVWDVYDPYHGHASLDGTSIQGDATLYHGHAKVHRAASMGAGRPWAIYGDEQGPPVAADMSNLELLRKHALYGNLMGGGAGVEWYFGYQNDFFGDVQTDDLSLAEPLWDMTAHTQRFFAERVSIERLVPNEWLTTEGDDRVLADVGTTYLVQRPDGGGATLDLGSSTHTFRVRWFDPKTGGEPAVGSVATITGPGQHWIGTPPFAGDALAWVTRQVNAWPSVVEARAEPATLAAGGDLVVSVLGDDPNGPADLTNAAIFAFGPSGAFLDAFALDRWTGRRAARRFRTVTLTPGTYTLVPVVQDAEGAYTFGAPVTFEAVP